MLKINDRTSFGLKQKALLLLVYFYKIKIYLYK